MLNCTTSAAVTCAFHSGSSARPGFAASSSASTRQTTLSSRAARHSTGSVRPSTMPRGSATPLASITISSGGCAPAITVFSVRSRSPCSEQQMQPFFRPITASVAVSISFASMLMLPKSLTMAAIRNP